MNFNNFKSNVLTKEQQNKIIGGNWRAIRNPLIKHYGTAVTHISSEIETSFNPLTGQMSPSSFITLTMEFADGSGEVFQVNILDFSLYYDRIVRIFNI